MTSFSSEDQSLLILLLRAANPCETEMAHDANAVNALEEFKARALTLLEAQTA